MKSKSSNKSFHKASIVKNDEFYTNLTDIENELKHYKDQFYGKIVFCNCDDPMESNFVKYFSMNFEHLGLKKLIATHYIGSSLFIKKAPYKLEYTGDKDGNRIPDPAEFVTEMIGTGDFRSKECIDLLKEADIIVTNPPFSLFREYIAQLIEYDKNFLIIGNDNARTYKDIFKLIKENKIWPGYERVKEFKQPDNTTKKFGNVGWFTNLYVKKRHEFLTLYKKYKPKEYLKYDNYEAIEVSKIVDIPLDYKGIMGVPITFIDKYNPDQFRIIGIDRYVKDNPNYGKRFSIKGREIYARILIKNKKVKKII